jgi:hypothetical protein
MWYGLMESQPFPPDKQEQLNFQWNDDEVRFELDQHAELDFYIARSLKQQLAGRHVTPLGHIILIPSPPVFFSLMLCT